MDSELTQAVRRLVKRYGAAAVLRAATQQAALTSGNVATAAERHDDEACQPPDVALMAAVARITATSA